MATHSRILPRKSPGQRSLVGYSLGAPKESNMPKQLSMQTHKTFRETCDDNIFGN